MEFNDIHAHVQKCRWKEESCELKIDQHWLVLMDAASYHAEDGALECEDFPKKKKRRKTKKLMQCQLQTIYRKKNKKQTKQDLII